MFICMSHIEEMLQTTANLQFLILVSHVMLCLTVQVQSAPAQASSQRHVGFGQETEGYSMLFDAIRGFFFMIRCLISA